MYELIRNFHFIEARRFDTKSLLPTVGLRGIVAILVVIVAILVAIVMGLITGMKI